MSFEWEELLRDPRKARIAERAMAELDAIEDLDAAGLREMFSTRLLRGEPDDPRGEIGLLRCIVAWFLIHSGDNRLRLFWLWLRMADMDEEEMIQ